MNGQLYQECELYECHIEPVCVNCMYCEKHCMCLSAAELKQKQIHRQKLQKLRSDELQKKRIAADEKAAWVAELTDGLEKSFVLDGCTPAYIAWQGSDIPYMIGEKTRYPDWVLMELDDEVFYSHYYGNAHVIFASQNTIDQLIIEYYESYVRNYSQEKFDTKMTHLASKYPDCIGGDVATRSIELGLVKSH